MTHAAVQFPNSSGARSEGMRTNLGEKASARSRQVQSPVLVIEGEPLMRLTLSCFFDRRGFYVTLAANIGEAKILYGNQDRWAAIICDYHLDDGNGLQFQAWIRTQSSTPPPFLLISGTLNVQAARGVDFLAKPFALSELEGRIQTWLDASKKSAEAE